MSLHFISTLLRASTVDQRVFTARQLPTSIFREHAPYMRWINEYRSKHGVLPTAKAFEHRFPSVVLPKPSKKDTIISTLTPVLDTDSIARVSQLVAKTKELIASGEDVASVVAAFKTASNDLPNWSATGEDDLRFSDGQFVHASYLDRSRSMARSDTFSQPTPWATINELMQFMDAGEYAVMASRTSVGKTWLLLNWVNYLDAKGERVLFVSKEMPKVQVSGRLEAIRFKLPYPAFRRGNLPPEVYGRWRRQRLNYKDTQLVIVGRETVVGTGFDEITTSIERYKPSVVVVDGAYLLRPPETVSRNAGTVERLTAISNMFKRMAKTHNVRVIVTIQINREGEDNKGNTRGGLRTLYGADAWGQDADTVISVSGSRSARGRILSIDKGRDSAVGEVCVSFQLDPCPDFSQLGAQLSGSRETIFGVMPEGQT